MLQLTTVRKDVVDPMATLLKLHDGPQKVMRKRNKRLLHYLRQKSIKDRGDKPDKKTVEQGEQFVALNDTLKDELPKLYSLTAKLVQSCLSKFVQIQATWFNLLRIKLEHLTSLVPEGDVQNIVEEFSINFTIIESQVLGLGICNGSILADFMHDVKYNSQISSSSGRRSSTTANSSAVRGGSSSFDEPSASTATTAHNKPGFYHLPGADRRISSKSRANSAVSNHVAPDVGERQPNNNSGIEQFPRLPSLDLDTPILDEVLGAAQTHGNEDKVLFLAASIYEFNIDRARRESGYPYLTYVAGEIFDVVAEEGELWLARNQDDPSHQLGWIWNKHFAKLVG